jgi:hypothetical protein
VDDDLHFLLVDLPNLCTVRGVAGFLLFAKAFLPVVYFVCVLAIYKMFFSVVTIPDS